AKHGERRPHLVSADGVKCHLDYFAVIASAQHRNFIYHETRRYRGSGSNRKNSVSLRLGREFHNSNLNAAMGSSLAARFAGYTPKNTPTLADTSRPAPTAQSLISDGMPMIAVMPLANTMPKSTPSTPPTSAMVPDSIRNCNSTSW